MWIVELFWADVGYSIGFLLRRLLPKFTKVLRWTSNAFSMCLSWYRLTPFRNHLLLFPSYPQHSRKANWKILFVGLSFVGANHSTKSHCQEFTCTPLSDKAHFGVYCLYRTHLMPLDAFRLIVVDSAKAPQKCQLRRWSNSCDNFDMHSGSIRSMNCLSCFSLHGKGRWPVEIHRAEGLGCHVPLGLQIPESASSVRLFWMPISRDHVWPPWGLKKAEWTITIMSTIVAYPMFSTSQVVQAGEIA
jgi:hypothetical protein